MQDEVIQLSEILNSTWGHAAVWFGALWATYLFVNKVFRDAEEVLHPDKRKALSDELLRIKDRDASSWVPDFTLVFDRFFGKKHLSWRCFYRSSLISIFVFAILIFLYGEELYIDLRENDGLNIIEALAFLMFMAILFNAAIDYISLLQTRTILNVPIPILVKIILDIILTTLLSILWIVFIVIVFTDADINIIFFEFIAQMWLGFIGEADSKSTIIIRTIIATSFTTSIWIWLHGLSVLVIRVLSNVQKFMGWLNVKEAPLRAIGTTINLIVLTFGVLLFPVYLLY